jgi:hypothetical protein
VEHGDYNLLRERHRRRIARQAIGAHRDTSWGASSTSAGMANMLPFLPPLVYISNL